MDFFQRDEAQSKITALQDRNEKDAQQYAAELKELQRTLDHDEKLKDFLFHKSNDRAFAADFAEEEREKVIVFQPFLSLRHPMQTHSNSRTVEKPKLKIWSTPSSSRMPSIASKRWWHPIPALTKLWLTSSRWRIRTLPCSTMSPR